MNVSNNNLTGLYFLWEISKALNSNFNPQEMSNSITTVFQMFLNIEELNIYVYDENTDSMRDFSKNWCLIADKSKKDYFKQTYDNLSIYCEQCFILNNELVGIDYNHNSTIDAIKRLLKPSENTIILPIVQRKTLLGIIEVNFTSIHKEFMTIDFFMSLRVAAAQISASIINLKLHEQMQKNVSFHQSMKDIAKIIEVQYELAYIIPLIGEMIDKFISDHLVYVFNKNESGKFELLWPSSCDEVRLEPILDHLNKKPKVYISEDRSIGVFPLIAEGKTTGAIIADGKFNKLTESEIDYLEQLTAQASITIDKANTYAEILKHASMDALTGLNNRRQFELRLKQETAVAKRKKQPLCCMMLDVDYFKKINDTYGHAVGDYALKELAKIITDTLREYDFAARYGGEEFCILLPSTTIKEAQLVASRLKDKVENAVYDVSSFELCGVKNISITVSIGISEFSASNADPNNLYQLADKALYQAKNSGRNQIVLSK